MVEILIYLLKFFCFKLKLFSKYCITVWEDIEGKESSFGKL